MGWNLKEKPTPLASSVPEQRCIYIKECPVILSPNERDGFTPMSLLMSSK